jgi:hypothetical protein
VVGCCEHGNEHQGSVRGGEFTDSAPWSQSVSQSVSQPVSRSVSTDSVNEQPFSYF